MSKIENLESLEQEKLEADPDYIKMDYTLATPEERTKKVNEIIAGTPSEKLTSYYLERLTKYILDADKQSTKEEKTILTENRMVTVNKRETSFEGLVDKFESNENGNKDNIYNMITNDKNIIFTPKVSITEEDIEEVPGLKPLREEILKLEKTLETARGKRAFLLKKQLIEMRQDQYVLKNAFRKPINCTNVIRTITKIDLSEEIGEDENGKVYSTGLINFYNPTHISALLCNYSKLKEDSWDNLHGDIKWMMEDLDTLIEKSIKNDYPMYYKIIIYKIDGKSNQEIQNLLLDEFGQTHSVEYISSLWRNKIPKIISEYAAKDWLIWHYTFVEKGQWKKCSCCGQIKLANNYFFSKNSTSKDGFYSLCKKCRNAKNKKTKG